ncbi:MAG: ferrous iron transporter B, partial [Flavobacteriaceae bacterium]|nr:ferrous iron transporter B [Flavobacteriaceae bacterium]
LKNVAITVAEKTKSFVFGAGKIILAISIVLWFLGSNGLSDNFKDADRVVAEKVAQEGFTSFNQANILSGVQAAAIAYDSLSTGLEKNQWLALEKERLEATALNQEIASFKLENSYMGYLGKAITPIVAPLGYDWKIGIAVLTSFAAREVFVGTLATIYAVGTDEVDTIQNRMAAETNPRTKGKLFNLASGVSLMLFYAFALQCMSTLAVVKRETNSWYWPSIQFAFMSGLAYLVALIAYQILK